MRKLTVLLTVLVVLVTEESALLRYDKKKDDIAFVYCFTQIIKKVWGV